MDELDDRRRWERHASDVDGTFRSEDGVSGLVMIGDISRFGLGCSLNRPVTVGERLVFDLHIPGSTAPAEAVGRVVWTGTHAPDWTYDYDAGVRIEAMETWDRARALEHAYRLGERTEREPGRVLAR